MTTQPFDGSCGCSDGRHMEAKREDSCWEPCYDPACTLHFGHGPRLHSNGRQHWPDFANPSPLPYLDIMRRQLEEEFIEPYEMQAIRTSIWGALNWAVGNPALFLDACTEAGTMREVDSATLLVTAWCEV